MPIATIISDGTDACTHKLSEVACQTHTGSGSTPNGRKSKVTGSSFNESIATSVAAAMMPARASGSSTRVATRSRPAPSVRAEATALGDTLPTLAPMPWVAMARNRTTMAYTRPASEPTSNTSPGHHPRRSTAARVTMTPIATTGPGTA